MATIGNDISQAKKLLLQGELVGIPTETVYGLAANALNPEAVTQIFVAKENTRANHIADNHCQHGRKAKFSLQRHYCYLCRWYRLIVHITGLDHRGEVLSCAVR